nr:extracellular solute-binding protein [Nocardiopsis mwathae]
MAAAASAALLLTTACGGGGEDGADSADKIEIWRMGDASEAQNEFMDAVTAEFQEEHPDTEVEIQWIPWDEFAQRFQTAMVSDGPDVVEIGNDQVRTWAEAGALYDVSSYAEDWENRGDFLEGAYANGTFDDAQYSVPWYSGVRALWYRSDWLEDIGKEPPTTWAELRTTAQAIEEEKDAVGFAAPTDFVNGVASFVWSAGGDFATKDGDTWTGQLESKETREALEFYADLTKDGISPEACIGLNEVDCAHADFANGKLGMFIDGPWAKQQLEEIGDTGSEHWATAPIPGKDGIAPAFGGGADLAVWGTTEVPDVAFDYIKVINSKENSLAYNEVSTMFPAYGDLLESDTFADDPILAGAAEQATGDLRLFPDTANWGHVQWELATVQNAVRRLADGEDAAEVLPELNGELTDALNRSED